MKFILVALLVSLLLSPSIVFAEWVHIEQLKLDDGRVVDHYFDSGFNVDGNTVYVWYLYNHPVGLDKENEKRYSVTSRDEYDCRAMKYRNIAQYEWDGPMGTGTPTRLEPDMEWLHSSLGAEDSESLKIVCSAAGL